MSDRLSSSELRIAGFGDCMMSGYPHKAGGFFETACRLIERNLSRPVRSTTVSLAGYSAPRAEKYLKSKVLDFTPDYVVIQFASTDAQCPIRRANRNPNPASSSKADDYSAALSYHSKSPMVFSPLRWEIVSAIGYLRRIDPITPLPLLLATMRRMAEACAAAGAIPVVLSPFVYGSRYTMTHAVAYTTALRDLAEAQQMTFVDCVDLLRSQPKSLILQYDGFHLSPRGHELVGQAVAQSIVADFKSDTVSSSGARLSDPTVCGRDTARV
jgi:GDSL-like Lipase/Acylhydrolase family